MGKQLQIFPYNFIGDVVMADAIFSRMRCVGADGKTKQWSNTRVIPEDFDTWADTHAVQWGGLYKKTKKMPVGTITCTHCHETFIVHKGIDTDYGTATDEKQMMTTCPHCRQRLKVERVAHNKKLWSAGLQTAVLYSRINGIDCYRVFSRYVFEDIERKAREHGCWGEHIRLWHGPNGERVSTMGYQRGYYEAKIDARHYSSIEYDKVDAQYRDVCSGSDEFISGFKHYPKQQIIDHRQLPQLPIIQACLDELKSRAILHRVVERCFDEPMIETLVKAGQVKAAAFMSNVGFERGKYSDYDYVEDWHPGDYYPRHISVKHIRYKEVIDAIRVANRHRFVIDDPQMYMEYLDDMFQLGMDLHSPKYLCPDDLADAHYKLGRRLEKRDEARLLRMEQYQEFNAQREAKLKAERAKNEARWERERLERERREEERRQNAIKNYSIEKAPYLGIEIITKKLKIHVLQSVEEFKEEAAEMGHCVYRMGYWMKEDSIILSCRRRADNTHVSTIEIKFDCSNEPYIAQNRGYKNAVPPFYKDMKNELEKKFPIFKAARIQQLQNAKHNTSIAV